VLGFYGRLRWLNYLSAQRAEKDRKAGLAAK